LLSGTKAFSVTLKTAGSANITASDATHFGVAASTSPTITVNVGAFTKLQLLLPGETNAPGTVTGKIGTPSPENAASAFTLIVNAVDANWNLANTVTHTVSITSSDVAATLPSNAALVAGTQVFGFTFGSGGTQSVIANDVTDGSKTPSTNTITVGAAAQYTAASGGGAISADTSTGTFTTLTGPKYTEKATGDVGTGTIILNAPSGFVFDTGGTAPTVVIARLNGNGSQANNINGANNGTAMAMTSVSQSQLTFTVASSSQSGITCSLTWQNVRVRPTAGTPLAIGTLNVTGTATLVTVTN